MNHGRLPEDYHHRAGKRSGKPCIRGLRITVYDILGNLAAGMTHAEIIHDFPYLTQEGHTRLLGLCCRSRGQGRRRRKVKLLFDEDLPPSLVAALSDLFPDSSHVHLCGLGATDDTAIAEYAQGAGFEIVTKDVELVEKLRNAGKSPKLIWIRWGNISNRVLAQSLRGSAILIQHF